MNTDREKKIVEHYYNKDLSNIYDKDSKFNLLKNPIIKAIQDLEANPHNKFILHKIADFLQIK